MKHLIKPIILLSTLFFISCSEEQAQEQSSTKTEPTAINSTSTDQKAAIAKNVNVQEFKQLIEKGTGEIVDVRTPGEFNRGNIEGAKNINIGGDFSNEIQKLDKNKPVYVYCAVGGRSSRAMQMMQKMGFQEVYNLMGGYNAWARQ